MTEYTESQVPQKAGSSIFLWTLIGVVVVAVFVYVVVKVNFNAEKRCLEEGGIWSAGRECIPAEVAEEDVTEEGVGSLTLMIPDGGPEVVFAAVTIGSSSVSYAQEFLQKQGSAGSVALEHDLARIHGVTGDLVMPFVVSYGGTGVFTYVGVFEKTNDGYVHRDSELVGDRIVPDTLSIIPAEGVGAYAIRLSYKDRGESEALSTVPTKIHILEATIFDHQFDTVFLIGEGALIYKDILKVTDPALREDVSSPLVVEGFARGGWYSEARFPIVLADWDGRIIAEGYGEAQDEWMTNAFVPFKGTLTFTVPSELPYRRATLILQKDNPSGLPQNDDAFEIPVTLK